MNKIYFALALLGAIFITCLDNDETHRPGNHSLNVNDAHSRTLGSYESELGHRTSLALSSNVSGIRPSVDGKDVDVNKLWEIYKSSGEVNDLVQAVKLIKKCKIFFASAIPDIPSFKPGSGLIQKYYTARTKIVSMCGDVNNYPSEAELDEEIDIGASRGNAYLSVLSAEKKNSVDGASPVARDSRLCGWLISSAQDPDLLQLLSPILIHSSRDTIYGNSYTDRTKYKLIAALELAQCGLGVDCSATSWKVVRPCGFDGFCIDGRFEDGIIQTARSAEELREVLFLRDNIVRDIKTANCSELVSFRN